MDAPVHTHPGRCGFDLVLRRLTRERSLVQVQYGPHTFLLVSGFQRWSEQGARTAKRPLIPKLMPSRFVSEVGVIGRGQVRDLFQLMAIRL